MIGLATFDEKLPEGGISYLPILAISNL